MERAPLRPVAVAQILEFHALDLDVLTRQREIEELGNALGLAIDLPNTNAPSEKE